MQRQNWSSHVVKEELVLTFPKTWGVWHNLFTKQIMFRDQGITRFWKRIYQTLSLTGNKNGLLLGLKKPRYRQKSLLNKLWGMLKKLKLRPKNKRMWLHKLSEMLQKQTLRLNKPKRNLKILKLIMIHNIQKQKLKWSVNIVNSNLKIRRSWRTT